jgi:hypothetical protein
MTELNKNRYDLDKLPITKKTRDGLTEENINYIGAVGRMLMVQDEEAERMYEEHAATITGAVQKMLADFKAEIVTALAAIELRLDSIEENLKAQDTRLVLVERHVAWPNTFLRIGFGVLIALGLATIIFVFIHPYLK